MNNQISNTNISFSYLSKSDDFLNLILDNITSCILLLNKEMKLVAFNNALKTIFSNKPDEDLLYQYCGNAIGCAYQLEENKPCGTTSHCNSCELRLAALESYIDDKVVFKEKVKRPFLMKDGQKIEKVLQFSTRLFLFIKEKFIIMIIDDITNCQKKEF